MSTIFVQEMMELPLRRVKPVRLNATLIWSGFVPL